MATSSSASISVEKTRPPPFLHSAGSCMQSLTANILSYLPFSPPALPRHCASIATPNAPTPSSPVVTVPFFFQFPSSFIYSHANKEEPWPSASPAIRNLSPSVRIEGVSSSSKGGGDGGPAFVGQVFRMLDPSGNGLMTVTSHFDIPFISKRTPQWIKRMLATLTKREQDGTVFHFFMDFGDAASFPKVAALPSSRANSEDAKNGESEAQPSAPELSLNEDGKARQGQSTCHTAFQFPFGDWFSNPWSKSHEKANTIISGSEGDDTDNVPANPLLPKITMVGILMGETGPGQVSRANLKKTMEDLTKELEQSSQKSLKSNEETDPLFVANVGDYSHKNDFYIKAILKNEDN